jgi:hypothetical protein
MSRAPRRLIQFASILFALLLGLELGARGLSADLAACANRGLFKLRLLERHGPVSLLFLGSSRTQDGVSPRLVTEALAGRGRPELRGFNAAFTSTSLASLEEESRRLAGRPGLSLVVIELSSAQLGAGPAAWAPPEAGEAQPSPRSIEERLSAWAGSHLALVQHRGALIPEHLVLLPLLVAAGRLDGSEVRVPQQLQAALGLHERDPLQGDAWALPPVPPADQVPCAPPPELERLFAVARRFEDGGARVVFSVPPLSEEAAFHHHDHEREPAFRCLAHRLAARYPVLDLVAGPKEQFRDTTHVNARGRASWSRGLARALAALMEAP